MREAAVISEGVLQGGASEEAHSGCGWLWLVKGT
jgi:hypothetical protein